MVLDELAGAAVPDSTAVRADMVVWADTVAPDDAAAFVPGKATTKMVGSIFLALYTTPFLHNMQEGGHVDCNMFPYCLRKQASNFHFHSICCNKEAVFEWLITKSR